MVAVAVAKAQELGFETVACASTGNLANAVAAHAAAAGLDSYVFVPSDLEQRLLATAAYGTKLVGVRGSYDDVNRLCTQLCENRRWAFVNVNLRPYYAGRVENARLRDGRAARLGAAGPGRRADRLRLAVPAGGTQLQRVARSEASSKASCGVQRRARRRACSPVQPYAKAGWREAEHDRQEPRDRQPADGLRARAGTEDGWRDRFGDRRSDRAGIRLLAETTGVFTETAGGVTIAALAKLAGRGVIDRSERVVAYITGEGLKTLDAVRDGFEMHEIEPRSRRSTAEFAGTGTGAAL